MRRAVRVIGVVAAGVGLAGGVPAGAAVPEQAGEVSVEVETGYEGWITAGRAFPVTVTVTTDRLVQGTLQVAVGGAAGTTDLTREVEVTGGNTATFRFLAPGTVIESAQWLPRDVPEVQVELRSDDGDVLARDGAAPRSDLSQEVVGVLPQAAAGAGTLADAVPLLIDAGVARVVDVTPEALGLGSLSLSPLDQLVATPGELAALPDGERAAVLRWVDAGGHLLLPGDDAELAAAEEALPDGWAPARGDSARAGLGQVRSVPADWPEQLLPTPTRSGAEEDAVAQDTIGAAATLRGSLAGDAGVRLPPSTRLGVLLALYVLVAGPVAYLVVRRMGRRQLAWAAIPVLALSSTGVVVGAGGSLRRTAASAHVTVYEVGPGGATATTWSLLSNPRRQGEVGVEMPAGWTAVDALGADGGWDGTGSQAVDILATDDGGVATTRPPAGGFGFVQSQGPVSGLGDGLVVAAASSDDEVVQGSVRNDLDVTLEDVAVMVGRNAVVEVGRLGPGEEREFTVEGATVWQGRPASEREVWPDEVGDSGGRGVEVIARAEAGVVVERGRVVVGDGPAPGPPVAVEPPPPPLDPSGAPQPPKPLPPPEQVIVGGDGGFAPADGDDDEPSDETVVMAAWAAIMRYTGWNYRPLGQVVAVGWTEELAPPVTATGSGRVERSRSAVVGRATVASAGDRLTDAAVVSSIVRGPLTQVADPGAMPYVAAFDLPAGVGDRPVDPDRLAIHVPGSPFSTDVWTPDGWVPLPDVPAGESAEVDVPAGAVVAGQVFVRWQHPLEPLQAGRELVVYEKEPA